MLFSRAKPLPGLVHCDDGPCPVQHGDLGGKGSEDALEQFFALPLPHLAGGQCLEHLVQGVGQAAHFARSRCRGEGGLVSRGPALHCFTDRPERPQDQPRHQQVRQASDDDHACQEQGDRPPQARCHPLLRRSGIEVDHDGPVQEALPSHMGVKRQPRAGEVVLGSVVVEVRMRLPGFKDPDQVFPNVPQGQLGQGASDPGLFCRGDHPPRPAAHHHDQGDAAFCSQSINEPLQLAKVLGAFTGMADRPCHQFSTLQHLFIDVVGEPAQDGEDPQPADKQAHQEQRQGDPDFQRAVRREQGRKELQMHLSSNEATCTGKRRHPWARADRPARAWQQPLANDRPSGLD
ncbi:MAG: hypothetical protein HYS12_11750 [Planctomycetes bacterium]|nr:hypothetical protein [Planctomycetota bacterium]